MTFHYLDVEQNRFAHRVLSQMIASKYEWHTLAVALARFVAATPHSCDVERLISRYNVLKTDHRANLKRSTLKCSLYVEFNMPPVAQFDPRPAVRKWVCDNPDRRLPRQPPSAKHFYFKGVFPEASEPNVNESDSGEE